MVLENLVGRYEIGFDAGDMRRFHNVRIGDVTEYYFRIDGKYNQYCKH